MSGTNPNQDFCNSHCSSQQLSLLWQTLSDRFCKCFSTEKTLSAPSPQLRFLISLRSGSGTASSIRTEWWLCSSSRAAFSRPSCYWSDCEGGHRGSWLPQGLRATLPFIPHLLERCKNALFLPLRVRPDKLWLKAVPSTQHTGQDLLANRKAHCQNLFLQ